MAERLPDWLQFEPGPVISEEEENQRWTDFCKADLVGMRASFSNMGGDIYRIDGIVEKVFPVLGVGIMLELRSGATVSPDGGQFPNAEELERLGGYRLKFVMLSDYESPKISKRDGKVSQVILPGGIEGALLEDGMSLHFSSPLDFGYIYIS